ncbi:MAG: hypothetical protein ABW217_09035 [Polyangiaceae bacterium]
MTLWESQLRANLEDPHAALRAHVHERYGDRSQLAFDEAMANVLSQFFSRTAPRVPVVFNRLGEGEDIQRWQECSHCHPDRKWCDLPELPIPVEAHWWPLVEAVMR